MWKKTMGLRLKLSGGSRELRLKQKEERSAKRGKCFHTGNFPFPPPG
jgi:hypothetical protein